MRATKENGISETPTTQKPKTIIQRIAEKQSAFDLKEFAALMHIDYNTAYDMFRDGRLPGAMRVGSSIRLDPATISEWLREHTAP